MPELLPHHRLLEVVRDSPITSIDLVVRNPAESVLLGWRTNRPAQASWFVPGGRILKGERLDEAFARIAGGELGLDVGRGQAGFLGVYEHHYPDNFAGVSDLATHYVVLGYEVRCAEEADIVSDEQHRELRWFTPAEALAHPDVHPYTKAYLE